MVGEFQKLFVQTRDNQHAAPIAQRDYFPPIAARGEEIVRAIGSTPDDPYRLIYLTLISAITNAQLHVRLVNAYFVPDPQLVKAMLDAAAGGVDVQIILPSYSDSATAFHAGRSHYGQLLEGGANLHSRCRLRSEMRHAQCGFSKHLSEPCRQCTMAGPRAGPVTIVRDFPRFRLHSTCSC